MKYDPKFGDIAVEILSMGKSYAAVCAKLNIARSTLYEWRDNHPEFKEALDKGMQSCQAYWEEMGINGITGEYEKFSATPWVFSMKNRFRDDYKEDKTEKTASDSIVEKLIDKLID